MNAIDQFATCVLEQHGFIEANLFFFFFEADLPGFTRSVYKRDHALITPESHVFSLLPDWYILLQFSILIHVLDIVDLVNWIDIIGRIHWEHILSHLRRGHILLCTWQRCKVWLSDLTIFSFAFMLCLVHWSVLEWNGCSTNISILMFNSLKRVMKNILQMESPLIIVRDWSFHKEAKE
ncbi:hypothetical protein CsSME_00049980 [Camellia sinensis var. sinensis]